MGSKSDWETMSHADAVLTEFGIPHESLVVSAHRTPAWMSEYATTAADRGIEVILAGGRGADGAAGHRRPHPECRTAWPRLAAVDRSDAERRAGRHGRDWRVGRRQR